MDAATPALRALLHRAEAGELAGVAWSAVLVTGDVVTGFAGDFGGRIVQLLDVRSRDAQVLRGAEG